MRRAAIAAGVALLVLVAGCAPEPGVPRPDVPRPDMPGPDASLLTEAPAAGVVVVSDVDFGGPEGILLDVCLPTDPEPGAPAILSVHGGGWRSGDKAGSQWRDVCVWLASEGFVVFQPNYRLAPEHPFPAALDDLDTALTWLREAEQVERFGHDPSRLGGFGDSAGGNLVTLLATRPSTSTEDRFDGVVELSAPLDLTAAGVEGGIDADFERVQLDYLGCDTSAECPDARAASPLFAVDASDPPVFIVHAEDEFIPVEQAQSFSDRLEASFVDVVLERRAGDRHALGLLDDPLKRRIAEWLRDALRP